MAIGISSAIPFNLRHSFYQTWDGISYLVLCYGGVCIRKGVRDGYFVVDITLTVLGFNGIEDTDWENIKSVNAILQGEASLLIATTYSDTQIDLSWSNIGENEEGTSIERSTDGINYSEIDTVGNGEVAYSDTTCVEDTLYYYRVRNFLSLKYSDYSNVASDTTFMTEAQDYIDRLIAVGDDPDSKRRVVINELFVRIDGHGNLTKLDVLVLSGHDATGSLQNLIKDAHHGTLEGTNYSELDYGWKSNATTGYIDTHYNARTEAVKYLLDSASMGLYFHTNTIGATYEINGAWSTTADGGSANGTLIARPNGGDDNYYATINGGNAVAVSVERLNGLYIGTRTASNVVKLYVDGVLKVNGSAVSTKIPNQNICIGCLNSNTGGKSYFENDWFGGYFFGAGMTQTDCENMTDDLDWYFAEILKVTYDEVYDTVPDTFYKTAMDNFIAQLKTDGTWALGDVMYTPLSNNEINDRVNILKPQVYKATLDGAIPLINTKYNTLRAHIASGAALQTNFTPAYYARNFSRNSACIAIYSDGNILDDNIDMGFAASGGGSGTQATIKHTDGKVYFGVNSATTVNTANANSAKGLYVFNRISATEIEWYYNGVSKGIINSNSIAVDLRELLLNTFITAGNGTARPHSLFYLGATLSAAQILSMYNSFETLKAAINPQMSSTNSFEKYIDNLGDNAFNCYTSACTYNGKIYRVVMLNIGSYSQKYIYSITIATGAISALYAVGIPTLSNTDDHSVPAVVVDESGYIYMAHEELDGGGHESDSLIYRSDNPEDMTAFTLFQEITGTFSYHVFKKIGSTIFLEVREGQYHTMYKKASGDATFTELGNNYINYGGPKAYTTMVLNSDNKIGCVAWLSDNSDSGYSYNLWYIETTDGITWSNISGSFTKNIVTAGAVTLAELNANCLVINDPTPTELLIAQAAVYKNGVPYILGVHSLLTAPNTATITDVKVYYYSAGVWLSAEFTDVALPYSMTYTGNSNYKLIYLNGLFYMFRINPTTGLIIKKYTSTDAINWTDQGTFYSDNVAKFKMMTFVYDAQTDDYMFCRKYNPNSATQMVEVVKKVT